MSDAYVDVSNCTRAKLHEIFMVLRTGFDPVKQNVKYILVLTEFLERW